MRVEIGMPQAQRSATLGPPHLLGSDIEKHMKNRHREALKNLPV